MRNRVKHILALLFLLLFVGYWGAVTLFPHAHDIDGQVYVHSHPFGGTSAGAVHTPQQFQAIAHLSLLLMTAAFLVAFVAHLLGFTFVFCVRRPEARQDVSVRHCRLRAPPVC